MSSARIISPGEPWNKRRGNAPPPTNGIILSRLFGPWEGPKGGVPIDPPTRGDDQLAQREQLRAVHRQPGGLGLGPRAQPSGQSFFRSYGSILPTSLAYIVPSTRGCSPWRPDAVMMRPGVGGTFGPPVFKGRPGATGHLRRRAVLFQPLDPTSG
ncbi:hypothetical protein H6P81_021335 [Aristolochia fimbriata]|uniref:Uncharacterized protein n=1 Tax=Aristolochia fimbriata TaxID=158543 RepID=A0AAV7DQ85_ARIFI|nr:hypothetical protein H6P81_021335 [Aristolochia fimbriata]